VVAGVEVYAQQNCPDIQQIFSKQRKSKHQAAGGDGMSIHLLAEIIDNSNADQRQNPRVDQRGSDAAHQKVVRNQKVRLPENVDDAGNDLAHRLNHQSGHDKIDGNQSQQGKPGISGKGLMCSNRLQNVHICLLPISLPTIIS